VLTTLRDSLFGQEERFRKFRHHLAEIVFGTVVVIALGTVLVFVFERHAEGSPITNIGDSLFWTTAQVLTVSSQMAAPRTTGGRVVDVFLMVYAVVMIGALVSVFNRAVLAGDSDD
jgi:hypothetical protein